MIPGFNDAHLRPQAIFDENSPYYRVWLGGDRVGTMSDLIAALQRKAAITPPGKLINGYGYNDVLLGQHPNRHDLDKVSTIQPVIITHGSGQINDDAALAHSTAERKCNQDCRIPSPAFSRGQKCSIRGSL